LASYPQRWEALERLATADIVRCLAQLGLFARDGESQDFTAIVQSAAILPTYEKLLRRWLDHLVADDVLEKRGDDTFHNPRALAPGDFDRAECDAQALLGDLPILWAYIRRCGNALADIVTGRQDALETLFPAGSLETTDYLYHEWPVARYCNAIVRASVLAAAKHRTARGPLRVLEIGAGTGGTTRAVAAGVADQNLEYVVSDVSDFFLARIRRLDCAPLLRTQLLDIERDPVAQGWNTGEFDVVIAANVLHATTDLDQTLEHTRSLLAPGGMLVLYESTRHPRWMDVTTGLIAGWQRFHDAWRTDHALLNVDDWRRALAAHGFKAVAAFPEPGSPAEILGQTVLLARAPTAASSGLAPITRRPIDDRRASAAPRESPAPRNEVSVEQLLTALLGERHEAFVEFVRCHVARVLRTTSSQKLGRDRRLLDLGLDSLMAVELRNELETGLGLDHKLPATLVFNYPTIATLATFLEEQLLPSTETPSSWSDSATVSIATDVSQMGDDEVELLLLQKLEQL
jgi:SAM-dependent methyltransferase/acyl carrier protein